MLLKTCRCDVTSNIPHVAITRQIDGIENGDGWFEVWACYFWIPVYMKTSAVKEIYTRNMRMLILAVLTKKTRLWSVTSEQQEKVVIKVYSSAKYDFVYSLVILICGCNLGVDNLSSKPLQVTDCLLSLVTIIYWCLII